jgi:hypothetical protein
VSPSACLAGHFKEEIVPRHTLLNVLDCLTGLDLQLLPVYVCYYVLS